MFIPLWESVKQKHQDSGPIKGKAFQAFRSFFVARFKMGPYPVVISMEFYMGPAPIAMTLKNKWLSLGLFHPVFFFMDSYNIYNWWLLFAHFVGMNRREVPLFAKNIPVLVSSLVSWGRDPRSPWLITTYLQVLGWSSLRRNGSMVVPGSRKGW